MCYLSKFKINEWRVHEDWKNKTQNGIDATYLSNARSHVSVSSSSEPNDTIGFITSGHRRIAHNQHYTTSGRCKRSRNICKNRIGPERSSSFPTTPRHRHPSGLVNQLRPYLWLFISYIFESRLFFSLVFLYTQTPLKLCFILDFFTYVHCYYWQPDKIFASFVLLHILFFILAEYKLKSYKLKFLYSINSRTRSILVLFLLSLEMNLPFVGNNNRVSFVLS